MLAAVAALVVERVRTLAFVSALDATAFRRAVSALVRQGETARARALVAQARPAWVAATLWPLFDPDLPDEERAIEANERLMDIEALAVRGMRALRMSASVGSALGFLGAAAHIYWIFNGDHGLRGLAAGVIENEGLGHAVLAIAIGIATSSLALGSWSVLKGVAWERLKEARRVLASVEELLAKEGRDVEVPSPP